MTHPYIFKFFFHAYKVESNHFFLKKERNRVRKKNNLCCYSGMVHPRHPQSIISRHSLPPYDSILREIEASTANSTSQIANRYELQVCNLYGSSKCVTDVQGPSNIWRGENLQNKNHNKKNCLDIMKE